MTATATIPLADGTNAGLMTAAEKTKLAALSTTTPIANGGTGQTTQAAAFNALSPMTTAGDIIYGGSSGAGTRLALGTQNYILSAGASAPAWVSISSLNLIASNATANLTAGFEDTIYAIGTISSGTVTPSIANGNEQSYTNNGAHTLAPPSVTSGRKQRLCITVTNGASAGTITTSGFDDADVTDYATTNAAVFDFYIMAENGYASLKVVGPRT